MVFASKQTSCAARRSTFNRTARRALSAAAVAGIFGLGGVAFGQNVYWDVNGTTPGSGVTAATPDWVNGHISGGSWDGTVYGTWDGTTSNWNSDLTGGASGSFSTDVGSGNTGVFSAGTDATGNYFVAVPGGGNVNASGLSISQGSVIVPGFGNAYTASTVPGGGGSTSELHYGSGLTIDVAAGASLTLGYKNSLLTMAGSGTITKTGAGFFNNITDQDDVNFVNPGTFTGKWDVQGGTMGVFFGQGTKMIGTPTSNVPDQLKIENNATLETLETNSSVGLATNQGVTIGTGGATIFLAGIKALDPSIVVTNGTVGTITFGTIITGGSASSPVPITIKSNEWSPAGTDGAGQSSGGIFTVSNNNSSTLFAKWIVNTGELTASSDNSLGALPSTYQSDAITLNRDTTGTTQTIGTVLTGGGNIRIASGASLTIPANRGITLGAGGGGLHPASGTSSVTVNSIITGTGQLRALLEGGAGARIILRGANNYSGGTWITGEGNKATASVGVLVGDTTSLQGNIIDDGNLDFDQSVNGTYAGSITQSLGTGNLIKTSSGSVNLTGTNTYGGTTVVSSGVLNANSTASLPGFSTAGKITVDNGGTISGSAGGSGQWSSGNLDTLLATTTYQSLQTGSPDYSNFGISVDTGNNFTYTTDMTQAGGFTKSGGGTLTLTGNNTYIGNTHISAGVLVVGSLGNIGGADGTLLSIDGGTLRMSSGFDIVAGNKVLDMGNGGTIDLAGSVVPGGWSATINGAALTIVSSGGGGGEMYHAGAVNVSSLTIGNTARYTAFNDSALGTASGSPTITLDGGTLGFNSSFTMANRAMTITANGGTITTQGRYGAGTVHPQTVVNPGTISGSGSFTHRGQGILVQQGSLSGLTGPVSVIADTLGNNQLGGTLQLQTNLTNAASVSVSGTSSILEEATGGSGNRMIKTPTVSVITGGQINVQDNKMTLTSMSAGTASGGVYAAGSVSRMVQDGRNGGAWNGTGIVTTQSNAAGSAGLTTLGVARASDISKTTFAGNSVNGTDVLVMYTYAGDANLDGQVNGDDYFRIDSGFGGSTIDYANGDFNYDGKINADDYFLIDRSYAEQGTNAVLPAAPSLGGVSAVPEPASLGLLLFAGMGLRRRRRA